MAETAVGKNKKYLDLELTLKIIIITQRETMKRLDSCKLFAGADTAETLAGILGIEQTLVFLQNKKD